MMKKALLSSVGLVVVTVAFSITGFAQTGPSKEFPGIKIANFGKMDDRFYRGERPDENQFAAMASLGIKTIIDVSDDPKPYEKPAVEAAGMRYVYLPIVDKQPPTEQNIADFFKIIDDPATGVFYVHCGGGRHRTGNLGAVYRLQRYGWDFEKAYKEMKNYDFYSSWGHGKQKDFVIDYFKQMEAKRAEVAAGLAAASAGGSEN